MKRILIIFALYVLVAVTCVEIYFTSEHSFVRPIENTTVFIPCHLNIMDNVTVQWYRGSIKIADSAEQKYAVKMGKFWIQPDNMLRISNVQDMDSSDYWCQMSWPHINASMRQKHVVSVLFPPKVSRSPESGFLEVELNHRAILQCYAHNGNPDSKISWFFEGKPITANQYSLTSVLNFTVTNKNQSGEYRCVANNGIGSPTVEKFILNVLYSPQITTPKFWVHTAVGERVELSCNISGNPKPKVQWFFEDKPLNRSSRVVTRSIDEKHVLLISKVRFTDFGLYMCEGANFLGYNTKFITLSGLANRAVFKKEPVLRTETDYTLMWEVDSYSPIFQYNLQFRKAVRGDLVNNWMKLIIPADSSVSGPIYTEMYKLTGLEPASVYEAIVLSRNKYGWSTPSQAFIFSTAGRDINESEDNRNPTEAETEMNVALSGDLFGSNEYQENALWQTGGAPGVRIFPLFWFVCLVLSTIH